MGLRVTREPKRAPKAPAPKGPPMALREVSGHLLLTSSTVLACYVIPPAAWSFRSDVQRNGLLTSLSQVYAALAGRKVHLRVTHRPYPASLWARNLDQATPNPSNREGWAKYLEDSQAYLRTSTLADTEVYLLVEVGTRRALDKVAAAASGGKHREAEETRLVDELAAVDETVAAPGMNARPASQREVEWLLNRSIGLGLPDPLDPVETDGPMDATDLFGIHDQVDCDTIRFGARCVRLLGSPMRNGLTARVGADGERVDANVERYTAVLSMGRMEPLTIPGPHSPWMAYAERLPFPVEWSCRIEILRGPDVEAAIGRKLDLVRDQRGQYRVNGLDAPPDLERTHERARSVRDSMENADDLSATRVHGWMRLAVSAPTERECMKRVRAVIRLYKDMRITVEHSAGQAGLYREFWPGEPVATEAHKRHMPLRYWVSGLPQMSATVGDRSGFVLGSTASTAARAVTWSPHRAMIVGESSGLTPVVCEPGAGKSTLGLLLCHNTTLANVETSVLDPSGLLAKTLCGLPDIAGVSNYRNLLRGPDGSMSPYTAVPEPRLEQYLADPEYAHLTGQERRERAEEALAEARAVASHARRGLAADVIRMLMPPAILRRPRASLAITEAVNAGEQPGSWTGSLNAVVDHLERMKEDDATLIARTLRNLSDLPQTNLFMHAGYMRDTDYHDTLLAMAMPGLVLPGPNSDPDRWTIEEQMAVPLTHLAAHMLTRRIYSSQMNTPKVVFLDEAHFLARWASGKALFDRLGRDSRKWRVRVLVASQNPSDVLGMNVANLTSEVFIGRLTDDEDAAREALRLLGVPRKAGYEEVLAGLSPRDATGDTARDYREFLFRDMDDNVEKIRVDLRHLPHVLAALNGQSTRAAA